MGRTCALCREKPKIRCDKCGNEFCMDHSIRCEGCGTVTCIRDLGRKAKCLVCGKPFVICPECLVNGRIVRLIPEGMICAECGWSYK